jgi:hypothetical protein
MPRSSAEMDFLISKYEQDRDFVCKFWAGVGGNVVDEIRFRCMDGDLYFINQYLNHFDCFMKLTDESKYKEITNLLFNNPTKYNDGIIGDLHQLILNLDGHCARNDLDHVSLSRKSTHLPYVVARLDDSFKRHKAYEKRGLTLTLWDLYTGWLDNSYKQTAEYKDMLTEIREILAGGVLI